MIYFTIILLSFFISITFTIVIYKFGSKFGFVDIPNIRSSHEKITPRGGGIGISIAVFLMVLLFIKNFYLLTFLAFILSFFSLIDDKINLPAFLRFIVETAMAIVIILFYKQGMLSKIDTSHGLILCIGVIFILAIIITAATNFFNFMDGINGIAGFEAIISFGLLIYYMSIGTSIDPIIMISLAVIASTIGFLVFNFPIARVFMGDVGSVFLGFFFASWAVIISQDLKELLVLLSFQCIFYLDCISTLMIRIYKKQNIFKAHLMHLYQRLVHRAGWTHTKVTLVYSVAQIIVGLISIFLLKENLLYLLIFFSSIFLCYFVIRIKFDLLE